MTSEEINKIVETIAKVMGLESHRYWKDIDRNPVYMLNGHIFKPWTSMDDAFRAVDAICGREYYLVFYKKPNWGYSVTLKIPHEGKIGKEWSVFNGTAETPEAAVSLALYEFIKEK